MCNETQPIQIDRAPVQTLLPNFVYSIESNYSKIDHLEYSDESGLSAILQDRRTLKKAIRRAVYADRLASSELEALLLLIRKGFQFEKIDTSRIVLSRNQLRKEMTSLFIWAEEQLAGFKSIRFMSRDQIEITGPDSHRVLFPRVELEDFLGPHEKLELANMFREQDLYDLTWSVDLEKYEDKARENLINLTDKLFDEIPNFRSIARGEDWEHVTIKTRNVNYLFKVPDMRFHEFDPEDLSAYEVYIPQSKMPRIPDYPIFKNLTKSERAIWKLLFGRIPELRKTGNMYGPFPIVGEDLAQIDTFFEVKIKVGFWDGNSICGLDSKESFVNMDLLNLVRYLSTLGGMERLSSETPLYKGGHIVIVYDDMKHPPQLLEEAFPVYRKDPEGWRKTVLEKIPDILDEMEDSCEELKRIDDQVRSSYLSQAIMSVTPRVYAIPEDVIISALRGDVFDIPPSCGSFTKAAEEYLGKFSFYSEEELASEIDQLTQYGYLYKVPDTNMRSWYARSHATKFSFEDPGNIHTDYPDVELTHQLDYLLCREDIMVADFQMFLTSLLNHPAVFCVHSDDIVEAARKVDNISVLKGCIDRNLASIPDRSKASIILKSIKNSL